MGGFAEALKGIAGKVPEAQLLIIMATDGIPVQKLVVRQDPNLEAVAAEYTALLRASVSAASDTGLGNLHELTVYDAAGSIVEGKADPCGLRPSFITGAAGWAHSMRAVKGPPLPPSTGSRGFCMFDA